MVMTRMFGEEPDVATARATVHGPPPPLFDHLERSIAGRSFLVGDPFGIADVSVATRLDDFHHAGAKVDAVRWPALGAGLGRVLARPSHATCIAPGRKLIWACDGEL